MSYVDTAAAHSGAAQEDHLLTAALTPLHHITYLQGSAVLINLQPTKPNLPKKERNQFLLQDLAVDSTTVTTVFIVPSTQLLHVRFVPTDPYRAHLDQLQTGILSLPLVGCWSKARCSQRLHPGSQP
jgi:hypothetical protein